MQKRGALVTAAGIWVCVAIAAYLWMPAPSPPATIAGVLGGMIWGGLLGLRYLRAITNDRSRPHKPRYALLFVMWLVMMLFGVALSTQELSWPHSGRVTELVLQITWVALLVMPLALGLCVLVSHRGMAHSRG